MLLIVSNKKDYTVDFVVLELNKRKIPYFRFNTEDFPGSHLVTWNLDKIEIKSGGYCLDMNAVNSVWYRKTVPPVLDQNIVGRDGIEFVAREVNETLNGLWKNTEANWVNHPEKIHCSSNKLHQLALAGKIGFEIPETIVTNNKDDLIRFVHRNKRCIIKPVHSGLIDEDEKSVVYTNELKNEHSDEQGNIKYCPSIIQERIEKNIDVRITIFGTRVFSTAIHSQENVETACDWRRGDMLSLKHEAFKLPSEIEEYCLRMLECYGLKFGAFDIVQTKSDRYVFLELNPNGQWAWIEYLTKQPMKEALIELLTDT